MTKTHRPWYTVLYIQVLIAIAAGVLIGNFWPDLGKALNPDFPPDRVYDAARRSVMTSSG